MAIADWVNKCVVFLGYKKDGKFCPEGTGFFASYEFEGKNFLHLVTAQHLILAIQSKCDRVYVRINTPEKAIVAELSFEDFYYHPDEGRYVDVAVAPVSLQQAWRYEVVNLNLDCATREVNKEQSIGPGDEVIITGFFRFHAGEIRNIPIVRTGNIAAFPDEPLQTRSGPINGFLVEARSIGGLSGSPVFSNLPAFRLMDGQAKVVQGGRRHYLLGILKGHYDENDEDLVESAGKIEGVNVGIGIVTPSEDIIETMKNPDLIEHRKNLLRAQEKRASGLTDDSASGSTDDTGEADILRDETLSRMLNTPPKPRMS